MRVFVDSSVLFAAIFSAQGHARDLLHLGGQDIITLIVSQDVLIETERNLQKNPLNTRAKDAIIVAAAIKAKPDYLVTYDHRDLLDPPEVAEKSGLTIVRPEFIIQQFGPPE